MIRSDAAATSSPETEKGLAGPVISVIIPTYNRKEVLGQTLLALARQTLEPSEFEVVVVDDGSTDGTDELVRSIRTPYSLRYERCSNSGLAAARNRGLACSTREVVLFLDDDVIPDSDLLRQHQRQHSRNENVVVLGALPFHGDVARSAFIWYLDHVNFFDLYRDPKKYAGGCPPMPPMNGNSSVRRIHLEKVGAYDVTFRAYGGEDLDLGYRLQLSGLRFVYNGRAVGNHYHIKGFGAFCRDQERAGYAVARLVEQHPEVRALKRVDLVEDRVSRLEGRKKLLRIMMLSLFLCPLPVWLARLLVRILDRVYPLRRALVPFFRLGSHYYYAKGIRRYLRERGPDPGSGVDVPLVRSAGNP